MSIETRCPNTKCGARFLVPEDKVDKITRCSKCGMRFRITRGIGIPLFGLPSRSPNGTKPQQDAQAVTQRQDRAAQSTQPAPAEKTQPNVCKTKADGLAGKPFAAESVRDALDATQPSERPELSQTIMAQPAAPAEGHERHLSDAAIQRGPQEREEIRSAEDAVPAEWSVGDVILDTYEVRKLTESLDYAEGGFGRVYRVHHRSWNMDLAVKRLKPDLLQNMEPAKQEKFKANFEQECERWIELGLHPNIVSCYYVRRLGGIPRVFAEFMDGGSLAGWIRAAPDGQLGRLYEGGKEEALKRILDIAIQFAWGLQYAHRHEEKDKQERELIHQDVKPENVMMTSTGEAKVSDFGLAPAGTRAYYSPEQGNGASLTRKTDVWSWGVSVLLMFTGELTWGAGPAAPDALEDYLKTGRGSADIPRMPDDVASLLRRCFHADPESRPEMAELAADLQAAYEKPRDAGGVGEAYPREEPKPAELLADSLNNRALSLLDLGRKEEAERLLDEAMDADAHHLEATYNLGLLRWRSGRMPDDVLVTRLAEVCTSHSSTWRDKHLLGLVHLERGDTESASVVLEEALAESNSDAQVLSAQSEAQTAHNEGGRCLQTFRGPEHEVVSVEFSSDSSLGLSRVHVGTLCLWELATGQCLKTFGGPSDPTSPLVLLPGGRFALSGGRDHTLRLWELMTGRCIKTFEGHTDAVYSVSITADARYALSGGEDQMLRLWDLTTGQCIRSIKTFRRWDPTTNRLLRTPGGQSSWILSVSITPDGRFGISVSRDNTVCLWDLATGQCLQTFYSSVPVAVSSDGRLALSSNHEHTLCLWELATGRCLREMSDRAARPTFVTLSSDGHLAMSDNGDDGVLLWDLDTGRCLRTLKGHTGSVSSAVFSPDGRVVLSGGTDNTVRLWEVLTGRCLRTFERHTSSITAIAIGADGRLGLSGSYDGTLCLWQLRTGPKQCFVPTRPVPTTDLRNHEDEAGKLQKAAVGALECGNINSALEQLKRARSIPGYQRNPAMLSLSCLAGSRARRCGLRDIWLSRQLREHRFGVVSVAISLDGSIGISGSRDRTIRLWDLASGRSIRTLAGHTDTVTCVAIAPGARFALSGSGETLVPAQDTTLRLWDLATGQCVRTFEGHTKGVCSVAISPDGRFAVSGADDWTLRLWDLGSGRCIRVFEGDTWRINSVAISPDGRLALSGSEDKRLCLWNLATGRCITALEDQERSVCSVAISPDGRLGLSGSGSSVFVPGSTLRLWDLVTGVCLRTFKGHTSAVASVAFTPDGRFALSASSDKTLRMWDLGTGQCIRVFEGHTGDVQSATICSNGRFALSGAEDKSLCVWELDWEYDFPGWSEWDEGALPYLEAFLTLHCATGEDGIGRIGKPVWHDEDFRKLIVELQYRGYGWLRPNGVRRILEEMTAKWQGPPPLPCESGQGRAAVPAETSPIDGRVDATVAKEDVYRAVEALKRAGSRHSVLEDSVSMGGAAQRLENDDRIPGDKCSAPSPGKIPQPEKPIVRGSPQAPVAHSKAEIGHPCPQCGSDQYKPFRLGKQTVHKCVECGHQDYASPSSGVSKLKKPGASSAPTIPAPAKPAPTPADTHHPQPVAQSGRAEVDRELLRKVIRRAGDEGRLLRRVLFGWKAGQGSPEAKRVYDEYVRALPSGATPPDIREVVKVLLGMVDPVRMQLRPDKAAGAPQTRGTQPEKGLPQGTILERIVELQAQREQILARIQKRPAIDEDRVREIAREILADRSLAQELMAGGDFMNAMAREIHRRCEQAKAARASHPPAETQRAIPPPQVSKVCACGADNPPANAFCVACGKRLPQAGPKMCRHCAKPIPAGARFCIHCGKQTGLE